MRMASLVLLMLVGMSSLWAAPLDIKSDRLEVEHGKQRSEFIGSVVLTQDDFILHCDRLLAFYRMQEKHEIERLEGYGHVRMQQGTRRGSAEKAVYEEGKSLLTLIGHAEVIEGDDRLRGERIEYNLHTEEMRVTQSEKGERVRLVIESDDTSEQK